MRIVHFKSGLGNQIFYYLFYLFLRDRFPKENIYGYYLNKDLKSHNGLEIDKVFDIVLPPATILSNIVAFICRLLSKLGFKMFKQDKDPVSLNGVLYSAYYQDKKYFRNNIGSLSFRKFPLDIINKNLLRHIEDSNSVSIHIRRGDYLNPENRKIYGNIATPEYYKKAIEIVKKEIESPVFFIFSNDPQWCIENLNLQDAVVVSNNIGDKSYIDMFLMSHCRVNIIANSSFSYWAAMLNKNDNKEVIYPRKWNNELTPDIFPSTWLGL
jgi:hypothetical protein